MNIRYSQFTPLTIIAIVFVLLWLPVRVVAETQWPIPGRNEIPKDAKQFFLTFGSTKKEFKIHIIGDTVEAKGDRSDYKISRLPMRDTYIYADAVGQGQVLVLQDPSSENGYEAILSVRPGEKDKGKYRVRAFYSLTRPKDPAFVKLIRIPDPPEWWAGTHRYTQAGLFWGEQGGRSQSLIDRRKKPAFRWQGEVDQYAVLAFDGRHLKLIDYGFAGSRTKTENVGNTLRSIQGHYLILSECSGPGQIRVIQQMNIQGVKPEILIEINYKYVKGISRYSLTGYLVPNAMVDDFYRPEEKFAETWSQAKDAQSKGEMLNAADHWSRIATQTKDEITRLWAIEKFCMLQPYPGKGPNAREEGVIKSRQKKEVNYLSKLAEKPTEYEDSEPLSVLYGKNMILTWPKKYIAQLTTKWRHLAELDICMDWLKAWTGKDAGRINGKRMVSCFRLDGGRRGVYSAYRIHLARKRISFPPVADLHEVSHGFSSGFTPLTIGFMGEGLTDFDKISSLHFLGLREASFVCRRKYLTSLKRHMYYGGKLQDISGYHAPSGFYLMLLDLFCRDTEGNLDWHEFTKLFDQSRGCKASVDKNTDKAVRWRNLIDLCEKAFGKEALKLLGDLGLPTSNTVIIDNTDDPQGEIVQDNKMAVLNIQCDKPLTVKNMAEKARVYTNKKHSYVNVPKYLQGLQYTLHGHKNTGRVSCHVKESGWIYLCLGGGVTPRLLGLDGTWRMCGGMPDSGSKGKNWWTIYQTEVRMGQKLIIPAPNRCGAVIVAKEITLDTSETRK